MPNKLPTFASETSLAASFSVTTWSILSSNAKRSSSLFIALAIISLNESVIRPLNWDIFIFVPPMSAVMSALVPLPLLPFPAA